MGDYTGRESNVVAGAGGCVTLSLGDSNSTQLADHDCRKMGIIAANADDVKFSIDAAVSSANFAYLPQLNKSDGSATSGGYLILNIDNTNRLRVLGEDGDVVYYWFIH